MNTARDGYSSAGQGWKARSQIRRLRSESRHARAAWGERLAVRLPNDAEGLLESLSRGEPQLGTDGQAHEIDSRVAISREEGLLLYQLCCERRPALTLEVGLAYGNSTIYFLAALREAGVGSHLAIDPFQASLWHGIGQLRAAQMGLEDRFEFIEELSENALPRLMTEGRRVQFAFIDGMHRFDSVLMDFTLVDRLCDRGAIVVLDDLWMPSVLAVLRFIEANRSDWRRIPSPVKNACILEKVAEDEREWNHFLPF